MAEKCSICLQEATAPELPTTQFDGSQVHFSCYYITQAYHSQDWQQDVRDFHTKFGIPYYNTPGIPSQYRTKLRLKLHEEEFKELESAILINDIPEIADAIADLIYVLLGTALEYGITINPVWDEVQRTNMAKEGGTIRSDGKILKPEGWVAPDIAGILRQQGWQG